MPNPFTPKSLFRIPLALRRPLGRKVAQLFGSPLALLPGFRTLDKLAATLPPAADPQAFFRAALERLRIRFQADPAELARIPESGPCVLVCNCPFGGLEALVLGALVTARRPDYRVFGNPLLRTVPGLCEFVSPGLDRGAPDEELTAWLAGGGLVGAFPAGDVAHMQWRLAAVTDPPWNVSVARLARLAGGPVIPVYFAGRNSLLFHALGAMHQKVRAALLPRELQRRRRREVLVRIGAPIPATKLTTFPDDAELTSYLRLRTFLLRTRETRTSGLARLPLPFRPRPAAPREEAVEPVAAPEPVPVVAAEMDALLRAGHLLAESGDLQVAAAEAWEIPHLLREIGRLREVTFRQAGEGTGHALDLDRFDAHYVHLFVWNREKQELVGAYRLGRTDEILARWGKRGLYTSTLFRYPASLIRDLGPALELGRSFVRPEYQRSFSPLMLLWRGIGQFVAQHPRYRFLFGPVSISDDYHPVSRQLMVAFLQANHLLPGLAARVRPRKPLRLRTIAGVNPRACARDCLDIEAVGALVEEIERGQKGIPILLRQYLKLGGQLLGFNVDPAFGNVVDGLILIDMLRTDPRTLEKYMGKKTANAFFAYHRGGPAPAAGDG